jgi:single-strand DNA-binding protein
MLNQLVLVGRLIKDVEVKEVGDNKKVSTIVLAVPRPFKNAEGVYETDFIPCTIWNGIAETTAEYCGKGDLVGVKGRIQTNEIEKEDGTKEYKQEIIAEKITFLNTKKEEKENE